MTNFTVVQTSSIDITSFEYKAIDLWNSVPDYLLTVQCTLSGHEYFNLYRSTYNVSTEIYMSYDSVKDLYKIRWNDPAMRAAKGYLFNMTPKDLLKRIMIQANALQLLPVKMKQ